jgi:FkbM family methyltransferase
MSSLFTHPALRKFARDTGLLSVWHSMQWRQLLKLRASAPADLPRWHRYSHAGAVAELYVADALMWGRLARDVPELDAFAPRIRQGDVAWEIGANIGIFTGFIASLVGDQGKIVAIDPDLNALAMLRTMVDRNQFTQVEVVENAIANAPGSFTLYMTPDPQAGGSTLNATSVAPDEERNTCVVEVVTPAMLIDRGIPAPDFIKIDVEGHELEVLDGLQALLKDKIRAGYIEVHFGQLQAKGVKDPRAEIEKRISRADFEHRWIGVGHLVFERKH